ncbi:hypothetical protein GQ43DRAFT_476599 [Delitschia confertaspora ATCC 74209]|uniref:Uncharacterized protein n=1 Tax=Delitschia confertaspora ATCC 74209 TaxID=1513339 RepID=A0A9P4MQM5_9PLEO|nr:hypothetical protein GQ43DRAFT_476599 [Delitschia confertaspora ATCC 74209]
MASAQPSTPPPLPSISEAIYQIPPLPPDEPPPSYDEATHSSSAPLLVGPQQNTYGTYRAYPGPETASPASSVIQDTTRTLPEWVGQALVVLCFLAILYGFYNLVSDPDAWLGGD